jgi:hypothetical protein
MICALGLYDMCPWVVWCVLGLYDLCPWVVWSVPLGYMICVLGLYDLCPWVVWSVSLGCMIFAPGLYDMCPWVVWSVSLGCIICVLGLYDLCPWVILSVSLGVSTQNIRRKIKGRMDNNKHLAMWRCLSSTQREARKPISGPSSTDKTKLPSCNRIQVRVVIGLPTGHNTQRKHFNWMRPISRH